MSSSFLDNPVLKVSRPVAACSRCRTAKIKCDGKLPACSACEKAGKAGSCSGAADEFAKVKERSYVASLEGYCERLERTIREVRRRQQGLAAGDTGVVQESSITSISWGGTGEKAHRKEASDIDDLVGDFGFLSVNATSRDFRGITSNTSLAQLLLTVSTREPLPRFATRPLPPRHEVTPLIQFYFDNIFVQMPFFTETNFWTSVDAVYQDSGRFAKSFDHWIVRMVLAISSASLSHQRGSRNYQRAMSLVSAALDYSEDVLHPGSIAGVQAILLLAQYSLVDPEHFRSWYLVGMAARVAVDLGLHQDPPAEVLTDDDRLDLRRRVFYGIYTLDRYISTASERAFSFSDDSVNVALPRLPTSHVQPAVAHQNHVFLRSLEPALHIFKIRQILSAGYQEMFYNGHCPSPQPLVLTWTLCAKAREWSDTCPKQMSCYFTLLCRLELLYTTIILVSPSHRDPAICDFSKAVLFDRCVDYVSQVHQVLENPSGFPFLSYVDVQRVHQVGRRFVEVLSQNYDKLLSRSMPEPPPVPYGTPEPPYLAPEDRINCLGRAIRCLDCIRSILQYRVRRWNMPDLLEGFERESAGLRRTLTRISAAYSAAPPAAPYVTASTLPLPVNGGSYPSYDPGQIGSREFY
ncbi:hypothetical protein VTN02DRAFT_4459 [Thermoascus thermophilus]